MTETEINGERTSQRYTGRENVTETKINWRARERDRDKDKQGERT